MNNFQFQIFRELIKKRESGENIIISPLSIYHILSLTANGADNKTLKEIIKALCNKSLKEINDINIILYSKIYNYNTVRLANAIFTQYLKDNLGKEFLNKASKYKTHIGKLEGAEQVNNWCSESTDGKITNIVDKIDDEINMLLINVIYFNGEWEKEFDKKNTKKGEFTNYKKEKKLIDFMRISDKFYCHEDDNMQSVLLNYKEDNMKALIILPTNEYDINKYIQNFSIQDYNNILNSMTEEKFNLILPKFEINFDCELKNVLMKLGMKNAFTDNADFSNLINDKDIKIDNVFHKAYIKVDEKGTKAYAATKVTGKKTKLKSNVMDVNHPFLFIIRNEDLPTGHDILFIAKIEDLKSNINQNTMENTDIKKAESQQTNNNNNVNLLDFDFPNNTNSNSIKTNDDINLLDDIFKNNSNSNNNNNDLYNFTTQSQINNNAQFTNNNQMNNCYNMNITPQVGNFNAEFVNKNIGMPKQDKKSNDPFDFINDMMKKK